MGIRLLKLISTFAIFTLLLILQKPVFCLAVGGYNFGECLQAMIHGAAMDMCMAGYFCIVPALIGIASVWTMAKWLQASEKIYFAIASAVIAIGSVSNAVLYPYWGFPLDTTPIFYFTTSPSAALASATFGQLLLAFAAIAAIGAGSFAALWLAARAFWRRMGMPAKRWAAAAVMVAAAAALFIPIRGGFTVSTMNLSRAYFSSDMRLNHAAIDPIFSLLYSSTHSGDYGKQFRLLAPEEAEAAMASLQPEAVPDSIAFKPLPFKPDVQIIILESFSSALMPSLGGEAVATQLDSIADTGLLFSNIYSSSFRTDRALNAILNGYPAQPTGSIMKHVAKLDSLPAIGRSLRDAGYQTAYYYGGDVNFTNMNALLVAGGYDKIVCDKDFPIAQRKSKWGAHDDKVFAHALSDWKAADTAGPRLAVVQTSSSHEPFEVPYHGAFADKRANAFAYADSCLGAYMRALSMLPGWDSTLVVIVPDHYGAYPELTDHQARHRIPLVIAGGAAKHIAADPDLLGRIGSQTDIAATLLALCGLPPHQFAFSHNLFDPGRKEHAFFSEPSWIGMALPGEYAEWSVEAQQPSVEASDSAMMLLKSYVQTLYDDIDRR